MKNYLVKFIVGILLLMYPMNAHAVFSDIGNLNDTLKEPVLALVAEGAISGYDDGTFRPNQSITVGEFAKILTIPIFQEYIVQYLDATSKENLLNDIIQGNIPDLMGAAERHEVLTVNLPLSQKITRKQAITYIVQAYKVELDDIDEDLNPFVDIFDETTQKTAAFLFDNAIIQGRDATHLHPDDTLTRAEASKILYLSKKKLLDNLYFDQYGWDVGGLRIEISDVSPSSLIAGETATIIFAIKDNDSGKVVPGIDTGDLMVRVVEGNAEVTDVNKIGEGVFVATVKVDDGASAGHLNVQISLVYGRLYVTTTDDYFDTIESEEEQSDLRLVPSIVRRNNLATIIAIPRDHHGDPVSGLQLSAFVSGGGGRITVDMHEDPVGTGIYIGEYEAGSIAGEGEIGVRILDYGGDNTSYLSFTIK